MKRPRRLEFWPDYNGALLHERGSVVSLADLPLPPDVARQATEWVARYSDDKLDGSVSDPDWQAEGRTLFAILGEQLSAFGIEVFDWEGIWSSQASDDATSRRRGDIP